MRTFSGMNLSAGSNAKKPTLLDKRRTFPTQSQKESGAFSSLKKNRGFCVDFMMNIQEVENWLQNASLPGDLPREIVDGLWRVDVAGTTLVMSVDTESETIGFCASLVALGDDTPAGFYEELLEMQTGELPLGLMFGVEEEEVLLYGRYAAKLLDAPSFDRLLNNVLGAVYTLPATLGEIMQSYLEEADEPEALVDSDDELSRVAESAAEDDLPPDAEDLSDEELLRQQFMQNMRI